MNEPTEPELENVIHKNVKMADLIDAFLGGKAPEEMAEEAGVHANTLRNWREGRSFPPSPRIPLIAKAFKVDEATLRRSVAHARALARRKGAK